MVGELHSDCSFRFHRSITLFALIGLLILLLTSHPSLFSRLNSFRNSSDDNNKTSFIRFCSLWCYLSVAELLRRLSQSLAARRMLTIVSRCANWQAMTVSEWNTRRFRWRFRWRFRMSNTLTIEFSRLRSKSAESVASFHQYMTSNEPDLGSI